MDVEELSRRLVIQKMSMERCCSSLELSEVQYQSGLLGLVYNNFSRYRESPDFEDAVGVGIYMGVYEDTGILMNLRLFTNDFMSRDVA